MNPFAKKAQPSESEVKVAVHAALAENAEADSIIDSVPEVETTPLPELESGGYAKLSKLIDHDFPFDESQLDAIEGICEEQYAALTGAAGTGKTTTTKAIVDRLLESAELQGVNMEGYWKKGFQNNDADDDYEAPEKWVPSIAMCAFTGRATQMIKKNFPRDWHGNIMTIHRLLGFYPDYYDDWDDETGGFRKKVRFIPTYNADFKLPWDVVIIDEAGMLGVDLWHQLLDALKDGCRIIMIGDINQLPPVHGKSIFGYAMCNWPAWELTHVHRQQGEDNEIVDNAWRIIHGQRPESKGRFLMMELKGDAQYSSRQIRKWMPALQEKGFFDPIRDTIITPINGEEGSRGFALGQLPLNREFALIFNPKTENPRYIIDGGRERKQFAVGDKVMATKNDWEAGITNGMTGIITAIRENAEYSGDSRLFGTVEAVNDYLSENPGADNDPEISFEELNNSLEAMDRGREKTKEKRERGPSSHVVTVQFGEGEHGFEIPFASLSEVGSLMTAYVVTCHKMQGGESPVVVVIVHNAHRAMLYREWLYTAVTRASQRCLMLYTEDALRSCLNKQKMPGKTLKEKVLSFQAAQNIMIDGVNMSKDVRIPESTSTRNKILDRKDVAVVTPERLTTQAERTGGLAQLLKKKAAPKPKPEVVERVHVIRETIIVREGFRDSKPNVVDGGNLTADPYDDQPIRKTEPVTVEVESPTPLPAPAPQLPAPPVAVSLPWVPEWLAEEQRVRSTLLLTHQPKSLPPGDYVATLADDGKTVATAVTQKANPRNPFAKKVLNHA